jgi:hypothetical protein
VVFYLKNFPSELRHGSGVMMTLDPTRLLIAFKEVLPREKIEALLKDVSLVLEDAGETKQEKPYRLFENVNHTDKRFWVRTPNGKPINEKQLVTVEKTLEAYIDWIGPVYRLGDVSGRGGLLCPLPNVLVIKPVPQLIEKDEEALSKILDELGLKEIPEKSKYLGEYRYFVIGDIKERAAYQLQSILIEKEKRLIREVEFENMPMIVPITVVPNDPIFPQQWGMTRIQAGGAGTTGWDISTGVAGVVVCVLDTGCDLTHPDLNFSTPGINLGTMAGNGAPVGTPDVRGHGTCCAGIVAARFNNALGVAGVAGNCRIMPVAFQNWTDVECAAGINWAANNGASVISMSFGKYAPGEGYYPTGWNFATIDPAITNAVNVRGCVLCAATGNEDTGVVNRYPARNPLVIAVGGSDQADNRKNAASPDGECWGANFGPEISVVAPCVLIPTTDIQGAGGFNSNNGGPRSQVCVTYPSCGDAAGNYFFQFDGTSAATPHVSGLAAAIRSIYPTLTNVQVRSIIERTAVKVGGAYADVPGFPNGTRNAQMGYGRINMLRALDLADVMIKDWSGDTGVEPSTPPWGDFWDFSDIAIRPSDDNVFVPNDPNQSSRVTRGQMNYLYIEVKNNGPREARNVTVTARITPYVGLQFVYPADWVNVDATHVSPTPVTTTFASIPAGGTARAKFTISSAQVDTLWGWTSGTNWHPCLLASVNSDNDYAFATASVAGGNLVVRRNNFAQRNLSVVDAVAGAAVTFPILAGNLQNEERIMEVLIDRSRLPRNMQLFLSIDDEGKAFPLVNLKPIPIAPAEYKDESVIFLERTRIETTLGCCRGILTLEKGSRFDCIPSVRIGKVSVKGGEVIMRNNKRFVEIRDDIAVVRMEKQPNQIYPLALNTTIPLEARSGQQYTIRLAQRNERTEVVGGATVIYYVK